MDYWAEPVADLFSAIESSDNLVLDTLGGNGSDWVVRMNFLQPPFNNVKMRQALLHLIDQKVFLSLMAPDEKFGRTVTSTFGTGSLLRFAPSYLHGHQASSKSAEKKKEGQWKKHSRDLDGHLTHRDGGYDKVGSIETNAADG